MSRKVSTADCELDDDQRRVLTACRLLDEFATLDNIAAATELSARDVQVILLTLRGRGLIAYTLH